MPRSRAHRLRKIFWVVLGHRATNSASQVRKIQVGPNSSAMLLDTYHSSLLPYSNPWRLLRIDRLGTSRHTAPMELYRSEVMSPTASR